MRSHRLTQTLLKSMERKYILLKSPGQGACRVRMSRRNTIQGLKVLATIVDEMRRVKAKSNTLA